MKKLLSFALVLTLVFAMAVPAMAATDTYTAKTAALSLSVSYDDEAVIGDSIAVNVTVTKTANGAVDYRVKAGDFDSGHQTYKNNDAAKTFTFYVDCPKTGIANLTVVLEEWQNKNKMNKAVESVVSISVECPGHEFINDTGVVIKERTCDEDGAVEAACSRLGCDAVGTRFLPAHNSWDNGVVTAPTCTEEGFTTYTCKFEYGCGKTKIENILAPLGHDMVKGEYTDPTCTEDGYWNTACSRCEKTDVEIDEESAPGHSWDEGIYTSPTREADGYTTYTCTRDGCDAINVVTDEDSQWVVTSTTADIISQSGNSFKIQVTEAYSGGADEVYTTATIAGNQAINNDSSSDFEVGPYTVTVARSGNTYTVTSIN